jgi:hypothetical protein
MKSYVFPFTALNLGVFFTLLCCTTKAPVTPPVSTDSRALKSHNELSLEEMAQVGNYLMSAFDKVSNDCAIPKEKIFAAPQIYRALADEKYSEIQESYLKKNLKEKVKFWDVKCLESCSCDIYVGFSEYLEAFNFHLSQTEKKAVEKIKPSAEISSTKKEQCLKRNTWVCQSRTLQEVLSRIN